MRVDWVTLCRYVEITDDGTAVIVGAGLDAVLVAQLPADVEVVTAIRILGPPADFDDGVTHQFSGRVLDPEMAEVARLEYALDMQGLRPHHPPGAEAQMIMRARYHFEAAHEGTYSVDCRINGISESLPIYVRVAR